MNQITEEESQPLIYPSISEQSAKQLELIQHDATTDKELPKQIIHKVQYGDTLQGLSLEYSVPIGKIRYRNHIDGDSIYHLKEIVIPNPQTIPQSKQKTQQLIVQQFVAHMDYSQKDRKVARYYLLQADWNMEQAMKQYRQDLQWEKKNRVFITSQKVSNNEFEMKQIRRYYERQELMQKKTI